MALPLSQLSLLSPPLSQKLHPPNITTFHTYKFTPISTHTSLKLKPKPHQKHTLTPKATQQENENNNNNNSSSSESTQTPESEQEIVKGDESSSVSSATELGEEIQRAMREREQLQEEKGSSDFWSGVGEEIREIEWPAFNQVLGTTGVVIGVIVGSSVVLLTVNAVLAELSDRIFAGKGVQDFFG